MEPLDLGLTAVAVLLFLFGLRSILSKEARNGLGCGYGLACGLICSWLFKDELGGYWNGLRLGLGIVLLMPAIKAIAQPQGKSIVLAGIALLLAVVVAAGPATTLAERYVPGLGSAQEREVEEQLVELRELRGQMDKHRVFLLAKQTELQAEVRALGPDKESVLAHPDAGQKLAQLEKTHELLDERTSKITQLDEAIARLELRLDELKTLGSDAELLADDPELDALMRAVESAESPEDMQPAEAYLKQAELEELYETEF